MPGPWHNRSACQSCREGKGQGSPDACFAVYEVIVRAKSDLVIAKGRVYLDSPDPTADDNKVQGHWWLQLTNDVAPPYPEYAEWWSELNDKIMVDTGAGEYVMGVGESPAERATRELDRGGQLSILVAAEGKLVLNLNPGWSHDVIMFALHAEHDGARSGAWDFATDRGVEAEGLVELRRVARD